MWCLRGSMWFLLACQRQKMIILRHASLQIMWFLCGSMWSLQVCTPLVNNVGSRVLAERQADVQGTC